MRYSIVINNRVADCIEADSQEIAKKVTNKGIAIQSDDSQVGWIYDTENGLREHTKPEYDRLLQKLTETDKA